MRTPVLTERTVKALLIAASDLLNVMADTVNYDHKDEFDKLAAVVDQAWREHDAIIDAEREVTR